MAFDLYNRLRKDVKDLQRQRRAADTRTERAEFAGAVQAFALADAPTAGVGDNVSYTSLVWISNGRRPGEGAGAGTGVLAFWEASSASWISVFDLVAVIV